MQRAVEAEGAQRVVEMGGVAHQQEPAGAEIAGDPLMHAVGLVVLDDAVGAGRGRKFCKLPLDEAVRRVTSSSGNSASVGNSTRHNPGGPSCGILKIADQSTGSVT